MSARLKSFLMWVALPAAFMALVFVFKAGLLAICFYAFFIVVAASRLMSKAWLTPLDVEREVSEDVVRIGDTVKVIVRLRNPSPLPILWLYAEETLPERTLVRGTTRRLLFIPPGRSFYLNYAVTVTRRGCFQFGPIVLESGDVFGLFKRTRVHPRRDFVTVLPEHHVIEDFQIGQRRRLGDLTAARSFFEDPTRIRGVREYRRGDAMKRIHWKASARAGQLRSKIYDPVTEAGATIVLDFHRRSWGRARSFVPAGEEAKVASEIGVEISCTICRYLSDGGWKIGFFSNGRDPLGLPGITMAEARASDSFSEALREARMGRADDRLAPISIRARRGPDQFMTIQESLGRIATTDGLAIGELLAQELPYIEREQVLVVVTGDAEDEFINAMLRVRELGYRLMVFVVCNNEAHDAAFEIFTAAGIELYRMDEDWRLREIATGRRYF